MRFLVPVAVYAPGADAPTSPPQDYLSYLLAQAEDGTRFVDNAETTVGGEPATLVTASVDESLDGSLGCQAEDLPASECFGLQPELSLRLAVVDLGDSTLVAWVRHSGPADTETARADFAGFEEMLGTLTFREAASPTADASPDAAQSTAIDGEWRTHISEEELASSPLLYDADEINDENWGSFTFSFADGHFSLHQMSTQASYTLTGTFVVDADVVRLTLDNGEQFTMRFSLEGGDLVFTRDESLGVAPTPLVLKPWRPRS